LSHFLVIFDRRRRLDPEVEAIDDPQEAQERLFTIERQLRHEPERGVVMLIAERLEDLERTHGQYFTSVDELERPLVASSS
jgi:hypothetical protein